jgi:hypothetical protein
VNVGAVVASLTEPEQLYELLDPDVMWYSADVNSNFTCNGAEDAIACIEPGLARGLTGHFELVGERDDFVVVRPVLDPPAPERQLCLLLRFRDGLIAEMRDFASTEAALRYAEIRQ